MRTVYSELTIETVIDGMTFSVLNLVFERFFRSMPKHSHGEGNYELHYIPYGRGHANIDGVTYSITPNTLYMTGPHVEHEQIPDMEDPMAEYCVYFKLKSGRGRKPQKGSLAERFADTRFWFGQDSQELYALFQQVFFELEHKYTGYMFQVEALLKQCIVKTVRNYENGKESGVISHPANLVDRKYLIAEESFLYDFEDLTLEKLAGRLGLSVRQTERFLKENYGKTFLQKKAEAKMSMAKIYLANPEMSIAEISERLNYSSSQHFSYAFRKYYGMSAREYRKGLGEHGDFAEKIQTPS